MRIIIENGRLRIKGSASERRAWNAVDDALNEIAEYGGGPLGDAAVECREANKQFLEALDAVCEWAPERVRVTKP